MKYLLLLTLLSFNGFAIDTVSPGSVISAAKLNEIILKLNKVPQVFELKRTRDTGISLDGNNNIKYDISSSQINRHDAEDLFEINNSDGYTKFIAKKKIRVSILMDNVLNNAQYTSINFSNNAQRIDRYCETAGRWCNLSIPTSLLEPGDYFWTYSASSITAGYQYIKIIAFEY